MLFARAASGQRHAEMKWSNHAKLGTYGVELVGWPAEVPQRNPSTLSAVQNQMILDALRSGSMWFRSTHPQQVQEQEEAGASQAEVDEEELFESAIDFTGAAGEREQESIISVGDI